MTNWRWLTAYETNEFTAFKNHCLASLDETFPSTEDYPNIVEFRQTLVQATDVYELVAAFEKYTDLDMFCMYLEGWLGGTT